MLDEKLGLYEFTGYITQLGSGSEVPVVGITATVPLGIYAEIYTSVLSFGSIGATTKNANMVLWSSNDLIIYTHIGTLGPLQRMSMFQGVIDNLAAVNPNASGFNVPQIMGGGQYMSFYVDDTYIFDERFYVRLIYKSTGYLQFTALGAGITLTIQSNKQI